MPFRLHVSDVSDKGADLSISGRGRSYMGSYSCWWHLRPARTQRALHRDARNETGSGDVLDYCHRGGALAMVRLVEASEGAWPTECES
jgi:hypothetical protein